MFFRAVWKAGALVSATGFLNAVFQNVFVEIMTIVIVPVLLGWWAKRTHEWSWPVLIVFVLVAIAAVTFLYDRFWPNPDAWRVHAWLVAEKYSIREESAEGFNFAYRAKDEDEKITLAISERTNSHQVAIEAQMVFGAQFDALPAPRQQQIIADLSFELIRFGISYGNLAPGNNPILQDFVVLTRSTDDSEFYKHIFFLRSAMKLFALVMRRHVQL